MSEEKRIPELGEIAYVGYFKASGGKSLISGAALPAWDEQAPEIRQAWNLGAMAVVDFWCAAADRSTGEQNAETVPTPGQAVLAVMAHRLSEDNDLGLLTWDELDKDDRKMLEDAAQAAINASREAGL